MAPAMTKSRAVVVPREALIAHYMHEESRSEGSESGNGATHSNVRNFEECVYGITET
jgi:hypothetical protein